MNKISPEVFQLTSKEVLDQIPYYDLNQHQPDIALETLVGSCAAKAFILAALVESRHRIAASMGWNRNVHGTMQREKTPLGSREYREIKHIDIVVPCGDTDEDLYGAAYGMHVPQREASGAPVIENEPQFGKFNSSLHYATIQDGVIVATDEAHADGYDVLPWREAAGAYLGALHEPTPDFEKLSARVLECFGEVGPKVSSDQPHLDFDA